MKWRSGLAIGMLSAWLAGTTPCEAGVVVTKLVSNSTLSGIAGITTDGTNLYVTSGNPSPNGHVYSVPIGGGAVTPLYGYSGQPPVGVGSPLGLTSLGSNLIWIDPNSGPFTDPEILTAPINGGGTVSRIFTGSNLGYPFGVLDGSGITSDGNRLYWADEVGGLVYAINPDGSGITQLGPARYGMGFSPEHLNTIAQYNGVLYIADSGLPGVDSPQVVSIPTGGGSFTTLFSGAPFIDPTGIAVGDNTIFVSDAGSKTIWSLPLAGGTPTALVTDPDFQHPFNLTFFDHSLYLSDPGTGSVGTIWKIGVSSTPEPSSLITGGIGFAVVLALRARWKAWGRRKT